MKFKLGTLFIVVFLVAIPCGVIVFLEREWFGPARIYAASQAECERVFANNGWQGYPAAYHYDLRIRLTSPDIDDDGAKLLYPILHDIPGLRYIELYGTAMTEDGIADMKREFPDCHVTVHDRSF